MIVKTLVNIVMAAIFWPICSFGQVTEFDFAVFNSKKASWQSEVDALKHFLRITGQSFEEVDAGLIQSGVLQSRRHRALLMPGGFVGQLSNELARSGIENIRNFIESGGGYLGICAGAALAACRFEAALETAPGKQTHSDIDYINFRYPHLLELWPGEARSPYKWAPFQNGGRLEKVQLSAEAPFSEGGRARKSHVLPRGPFAPYGTLDPRQTTTRIGNLGKNAASDFFRSRFSKSRRHSKVPIR